jgi:hypothetical protein
MAMSGIALSRKRFSFMRKEANPSGISLGRIRAPGVAPPSSFRPMVSSALRTLPYSPIGIEGVTIMKRKNGIPLVNRRKYRGRPIRNTFRPGLERLEDRLAPSVDILTYHNNVPGNNSGANLNETQLTPGNVIPSTFGLQFTYPVDGQRRVWPGGPVNRAATIKRSFLQGGTGARPGARHLSG